MTQEFCYLMWLHGIGSRRDTRCCTSIDANISWESVYRLAQEQSVLPTVAYALKQNQSILCPSQIKNAFVSYLRSAAVQCYIRKQAIIELLEYMKLNSIDMIVLKGFAVAECYDAPECRVSSDVDVLVKRCDEKKAIAILISKGFRIEPRSRMAKDTKCYHPRIGCVELHVALYENYINDLWFQNANETELWREPALRVNTLDGTYYTLGKTDHLIFITLHMIKHFITNGMSLRMMMDVALFYKANDNDIDKKRYYRVIAKFHYSTLIAAVFKALNEYSGIEVDCHELKEFFTITDKQIKMVLDDLEKGGVLGFKDQKNRQQGQSAYTNLRTTEGMTWFQMLTKLTKHRIGSLINGLFPRFEHMRNRYKYLEKHKYLLPYAWFSRIVSKGVQSLSGGKSINFRAPNIADISSAGRERIEMFKELKMIEK